MTAPPRFVACLREDGRRILDPFGPGYAAFAADELASLLEQHGCAPPPELSATDMRALWRGPLPLPGLGLAAARAIAARLVVCELYEELCGGATLDAALAAVGTGVEACEGRIVEPDLPKVVSWGRRLGMKVKRRHSTATLDAVLAATGGGAAAAATAAATAAAAAAAPRTMLALLITHGMSEARFADLAATEKVGGDRHAGQPLRWAVAARVSGAAAMLATLARQAVAARPLCGSTPIKPELSFIMANLARVRRGSLCVDPFCGTGSLLMAAAALGAHTLGTDIDVATLLGTGCASGEGSDVGAGTRANCASVSGSEREEGPAPELVGCDVLSARHPCLRLRRLVDCIITDPPYGLRHPEWRTSVPDGALDADEGATEAEAAAGEAQRQRRRTTTRADHEQLHALQLQVYTKVFELAAGLLVSGGRLVFLFPLKAATSDELGLGEAGRELPVFQPESEHGEWGAARAGFTFVACARQRFQNMDRYACAYEWRGQ